MPGAVNFNQPDSIAELRFEQATILRRRDRILKTLYHEKRHVPASPPCVKARGWPTSRHDRGRVIAIQPYSGCPLHLSHLRIPARTPDCRIVARCKKSVAYILDVHLIWQRQIKATPQSFSSPFRNWDLAPGREHDNGLDQIGARHRQHSCHALSKCMAD